MKIVALLVAVTSALVASTTYAGFPSVTCEATKLREAGKYSSCLLNADSKAAKLDIGPDYTKCDEKFTSRWGSAEVKAGVGVCPSEGDQADVANFVGACAGALATALAGGALPLDVGACNDALDDCSSNLASCVSDRDSCDASLATCTAALTDAELCGNGIIDSGEDCDAGNLGGATCVSLGLFGTGLKCRAGCTFDPNACSSSRYEDCGDGSVVDHGTGLMWQKSDDDGGVTDKDRRYTWWQVDQLYPPNGTVFLTFLSTLNDCESEAGTVVTGGYAGHCDWRLPSITELKTLFAPGCVPDQQRTEPCIDQEVFGPTANFYYWSSTRSDFSRADIWEVAFDQTISETLNGDANAAARAVRVGECP